MRDMSDWSEPTGEAIELSLLSGEGGPVLEDTMPKALAPPKKRLRQSYRERKVASDRLLEEDISRVFLMGQAFKAFEEDDTEDEF